MYYYQTTVLWSLERLLGRHLLSYLFTVSTLAKLPTDKSSGIQGVHHHLPAPIWPLDPQGVNRVRFAEKNGQDVKCFKQSYHLDWSYSSKDTLPPDPRLRWLWFFHSKNGKHQHHRRIFQVVTGERGKILLMKICHLWHYGTWFCSLVAFKCHQGWLMVMKMEIYATADLSVFSPIFIVPFCIYNTHVKC